MPREKLKTLTEQMYYILLCLREENSGTDLMEAVSQLTEGRVLIGPGTLYHLLDRFVQEGLIIETKVEGRRRSYLITTVGQEALYAERDRLERLLLDFRRVTEPTLTERSGVG